MHFGKIHSSEWTNRDDSRRYATKDKRGSSYLHLENIFNYIDATYTDYIAQEGGGETMPMFAYR
jgi:hypothetical protein